MRGSNEDEIRDGFYSGRTWDHWVRGEGMRGRVKSNEGKWL